MGLWLAVPTALPWEQPVDRIDSRPAPLPHAAQLIASIHQPVRASLDECLARWQRLDEAARGHAYLVLEGPEPNARRTLNAAQIAALVAH